MAWKIGQDHINPARENRVGVSEEHSRIPVAAAMLGFESEKLPTHDESGKELPLIRFRLFDDDGELYYAGELHDDGECENQSAALAFGANDAGCTEILVERDGRWTQELG